MKRILLIMAGAYALTAFAQQENPMANIDQTEDTAKVTTINDIIEMQQEVSTRNFNMKHFADVWGRRSYFNISYSNTTLTPEETIATGVPTINRGIVPEFKSDWGVALQLGRSYRLHKTPIANTATFNIDYTYIDFAVNHFKAEGDGTLLYDSSKQFDGSDGKSKYYYTPWNLQKYEASYGMNLGPSLTLAPFNYLDVRALHFIKFNIYYHIGYAVSAIYMPNDKKADINTDEGSEGYEKMGKDFKLDWGHGLTKSFGFSLSWKAIGVGYERRSFTGKYKSVNTDQYGDESHKFSTSSSRLFVQIRM